MKKRALLLFCMMIWTAVVFSGCQTQAIPEEEGEAIGDTLVVGMSCDNPPFGWVQKEEAEDTYALADGSGYVGGYDVQIAEMIGKDLDVDIELVQYDRGDLMDALEDGEIDLMISGVNPLETRTDRVDFSDSYYENDYVVIVLKDGAYASAVGIDDFDGARVTAQSGSYIYDELLPQMEGAKVMSPMTFHRDMRVALNNNVIDGYVTTRPEGMSATRLHPEYAMIIFGDKNNFETNDEYSTVAVGIAKDRGELLDAVNASLHKISKEERQAIMDRAVYAEPEDLDDEEQE